MEDCSYCKDKEKKAQSYLEEIENEKIVECQKALEREKIAKGMRCTRADEVRLKELQKMQMNERRCIENEKREIEMMWHQVLLDDCQRKENLERLAAKRKQQENLERRKCYDEQITSANKKRQELIQVEREKESIKLEKIKKKMEEDHYYAIRKKKDQQMENRKTFIDEHESKMLRLRMEKMKAREIDDETIRVALEELRKEREWNRIQMKNLHLEKQLCVENYKSERQMATALEKEVNKIADDWLQKEQEKSDKNIRNMEQEKRTCKEKAAEEYKRYIKTRNLELERAKQERKQRMERVKRSAVSELQRKIDSANQDLSRQLDYRQALGNQIIENEKHLELQIRNNEIKDRAFTMKAQMFKDVMATRITISPGRTSTNPVHPFKRLMESRKPSESFHLPSIG